MTVSPVVRRTAVLLLVALLGTSLSHADVRHQESRKAKGAERYINPARLFLAEAWMNVSSILQKEGSSLDPFGQPKPDEGSDSSSDSGSSLDPFGRN